MDDLWRWADPTGQQRQVRLDELRAALAGGVIASNTPVWRPGWPGWQAASDVPELSTSALGAANGVVLNIPPPPLAVVAAQQEFEAETTGPHAPPTAEPPPPPAYVPLPPRVPSVAPPAPGSNPSVARAAKTSHAPPALTPQAPAVATPQAPTATPQAPAATPQAPPATPQAPAATPQAPAAAPPKPEILPTAIGVPALTKDQLPAAPPRPAGAPAAPPRPASLKPPPPVAEAPAEMIEELSGSALLESVPQLPAAPPVPSNAPPPPPFVSNAPPVPSNAPPPPPPFASNAPPPPVKKAGTLLGIAPPPEAGLDAQPLAQGAPIVPVPAGGAPEPIADPFAAPPAPASSGALPPPTNPVLREELPASDPLAEAPVHSDSRGIKAILHDLRSLRPKNRFVVPVAGALAGAVVISLLALIVSAIRGKPSEMKTSRASSTAPTASTTPPDPTTSAAPPATTSAAPTIETPTTPAASTATESGEPEMADCAVAGPSHVVAPRAVVSAGVEATAVEGALAVAFATTGREGMAVQLTPGTLEASGTARGRGPGDARRVTGALSGGKLQAIVNVDRKADRLAGRRTILTSPPIDVGVAEGSLVWAPLGKDTYAKLFALPGEGPLEALRGVPLGGGTKGIAVVFRRANAIWIGIAKGEGSLTPSPSLHKISGLGKVGSPALAASGDRLLVSWADRASPEEPWKLRNVVMNTTNEELQKAEFTLPDGGLGVQAMSPAIAPLTRGRFLFSWTEGPVSGHQVRAITLGPDGATSGAPLSVSAQGINAGAPAAAVTADGKGVVAFLAAKGKAFEVIATPVECAKK